MRKITDFFAHPSYPDTVNVETKLLVSSLSGNPIDGVINSGTLFLRHKAASTEGHLNMNE